MNLDILKQFKNIRIKNIARKLILNKDLPLKDIIFLSEYLSKFNNNDCKLIKKLIARFNLVNKFSNELKNYNELKNLSKELDLIFKEYSKLHLPFYNKIDKDLHLKDLFKLLDNPIDYKKDLDLNSNHINFNYCIKVNLNKFLDILYYDIDNLDIIINKDISKYNSNELISFKISFENYYNNKFIYYNSLKLFKSYNSDNNYYYCLMLKNTFLGLRFSLNSNSIDKYYSNNKNSYYSNKYLKKGKKNIYYLSLKKVNNQYKPYNSKKYDIYNSFELLKLDKQFNKQLNYFLGFNFNKELDYLINDLNSLLDNKDKNSRVNNFIKELEFIKQKNILKNDLNITYLGKLIYNSKFFKINVNNHLELILNELEKELKDLDLYKEHSLYDYKELKNSKLKKGKSKNKYNVIDNNYNLDLDNNSFNRLELVFKLKN